MTESSTSRMFAPGTAGAVRAGAVVLTGTLAITGANYLYQVLSARWLGPADFGVVATLSALLMIVALPFGAVQLFVARDVAAAAVGDDTDAREAEALSTLTIGSGLIIGAGMIVFTPLIGPALQIEGWTPLVLTAAAVAFSIVLIPAIAVLQGRQHFIAYTFALVMGSLIRFGALIALLLLGFGLNGALGATTLGTGGAVLLAAVLAREWPASRSAMHRPVVRRALARVLPMSAGVLAVTALANTDIVVVKGALSSADTGTFGAAGLIAKVALFIPAAIIPIMQPRVAVRQAQGRQSADILARATLVTVAFGAIFTAICWATAEPLVTFAFGTEFAEAASILPLYCITMILVSVATLRVNYFLTRGERGIGYVALVSACLQAVALVFWHSTLVEVLAVDALAAASLIAADLLLHRLARRERHG